MNNKHINIENDYEEDNDSKINFENNREEKGEKYNNSFKINNDFEIFQSSFNAKNIKNFLMSKMFIIY